MDAGDPSSIDALLAAAQHQFAASLPDKVTALGALVASGAWADARRAAHKLRGSAATYGFAALAASAAAIEDELLDVAEPGDDARAGIAAHLDRAREEAAGAAGADR